MSMDCWNVIEVYLVILVYIKLNWSGRIKFWYEGRININEKCFVSQSIHAVSDIPNLKNRSKYTHEKFHFEVMQKKAIET